MLYSFFHERAFATIQVTTSLSSKLNRPAFYSDAFRYEWLLDNQPVAVTNLTKIDESRH